MNEIIFGIVADTHVPDRLQNLHPALIPMLKAAGVNQILHAGDICSQVVIDELACVAPVTSVQGNRDVLLNGNVLPMSQIIEVNGKKIGLMHGFGNFLLYFLEKFNLLFHGYQFSYFRKLVTKTLPEADVIVFGHTHHPEIEYDGKQLIFNPGSAGMGGWGLAPSFGILKILSNGKVEAEVIELRGAERKNGKWMSLQS